MCKFSDKFDSSQVEKIARSPAAQELMRLLNQKDPDAIQNLSSKAEGGDLEGALKQLQTIMQDPNLSKLAKGIGKKYE